MQSGQPDATSSRDVGDWGVRASRVAAGEPAWEQIFREHHKMTLRAAYRITGSAADAEDVLQTVFLRLLRRGPATLVNEEAYLRRAAVNGALDLVRARASVNAVNGADVAANQAGPGDPRLRAALRAAVARLPRQMGEIFVMRHFEELSNREIAHLLGASQVRVAVVLHRARRRLQRELATFWRSRT